MKFSHTGNRKLGKRISTISREVGVTCPTTCQFLNNGCYAEALQDRYPNVRTAWKANSEVNYKELLEFLQEAAQKGNAVRYHVGGDFLIDGKVDRKYISYIKRANLELGPLAPKQWLYTHVYVKSIADLSNVGVSVYASVDKPSDHKAAKAVGFKLFSYSTESRVKNVNGVPVCWEQLKTKDSCETCKYCINGIGDIVFIKH